MRILKGMNTIPATVFCIALCLALYWFLPYVYIFCISEILDAFPSVVLSNVFIFTFKVVITFVTISVMMTFFDKKPWIVLGFSWRGRSRDVLMGFVLAAFVMVCGFLVCLFSDNLEIINFEFPVGGLIIGFISCALTAVAEEAICRGYILRRLLNTTINRYASLVISAFLFALLHLRNPNMSFLPFFNLFLIGILFGSSYIYTRNLWYPISMHLFWNWIMGYILGFPVSGFPREDAIVDSIYPYNNIINGGLFGFEGSLVCTMLTIFGIAWTILYFYENKKAETTRGAISAYRV